MRDVKSSRLVRKGCYRERKFRERVSIKRMHVVNTVANSLVSEKASANNLSHLQQGLVQIRCMTIAYELEIGATSI